MFPLFPSLSRSRIGRRSTNHMLFVSVHCLSCFKTFLMFLQRCACFSAFHPKNFIKIFFPFHFPHSWVYRIFHIFTRWRRKFSTDFLLVLSQLIEFFFFGKFCCFVDLWIGKVGRNFPLDFYFKKNIIYLIIIEKFLEKIIIEGWNEVWVFYIEWIFQFSISSIQKKQKKIVWITKVFYSEKIIIKINNGIFSIIFQFFLLSK